MGFNIRFLQPRVLSKKNGFWHKPFMEICVEYQQTTTFKILEKITMIFIWKFEISNMVMGQTRVTRMVPSNS